MLATDTVMVTNSLGSTSSGWTLRFDIRKAAGSGSGKVSTAHEYARTQANAEMRERSGSPEPMTQDEWIASFEKHTGAYLGGGEENVLRPETEHRESWSLLSQDKQDEYDAKAGPGKSGFELYVDEQMGVRVSGRKAGKGRVKKDTAEAIVKETKAAQTEDDKRFNKAMSGSATEDSKLESLNSILSSPTTSAYIKKKANEEKRKIERKRKNEEQLQDKLGVLSQPAA